MFIVSAFAVLITFAIIKKTIYYDMNNQMRKLISRTYVLTLILMIPMSLIGWFLYIGNNIYSLAYAFGLGFSVSSIWYLYSKHKTLFNWY